MRTYPNQKIVEIMKSACDKNNEYAILNMDALHYAAKDLSATDFKLYIYLAKNKDGFDLALSKKAFMDWAGCQENTYRSTVSSLVQKDI